MKFYSITLIFFFSLFSFSQEFETNYATSLEKAKTENKNIMLVFSGSDWCGPCIKLKKEILTKKEFQDIVSSKIIIVNADFPKKSKLKALQTKDLQQQNQHLIEKYNKDGLFPFVVILSKDEKVLGKMGYEKLSPELYGKKIISLLP